MTKPRRLTRLTPERPPLTPAAVGKSDLPKLHHLMIENGALKQDNHRLRNQLVNERRSHSTAEALLVRMTNQLEQTVSDLRTLVFQRTAELAAEKGTQR